MLPVVSKDTEDVIAEQLKRGDQWVSTVLEKIREENFIVYKNATWPIVDLGIDINTVDFKEKHFSIWDLFCVIAMTYGMLSHQSEVDELEKL